MVSAAPRGSDRLTPHRSSWSFLRRRHEDIYCRFQVQSRTWVERANGRGEEGQQLVAWSTEGGRPRGDGILLSFHRDSVLPCLGGRDRSFPCC